MKSQALQNLVKSIFSDESVKAEFRKDPKSVIAKFGLNAQEKKAVLSSHSTLGLVTGGSSQLEATLKASNSWMAAPL